MSKELIKVNGCNEYFSDTIFVTGLYINGVLREKFPRDLNWLVRSTRRGDIKRYTKQYRREMTLLVLNISNFYNCVGEVYGLTGKYLPDDFEYEIDTLVNHSYLEDGKFCRYLPERFVAEEKFYPSAKVIDVDQLYFNIIRIKPQAISYLKQRLKDSQFRRFNKIIKLLEMMGAKHTDIDFDEYIDKWARRLLR